jgi:beta propeller repeat protein
LIEERRGKVKKKIIVLSIITFAIVFILIGYQKFNSNDDLSKQINENNKNPYYTTTGYSFVLSDHYMVVNENGLRIINLDTKKVIKEITENIVGGFDIYETKVVWSTYNNTDEIGKDYGYDETANTDIYLYDIQKDEIIQITTNPAGQVQPKIWGDYIVWQDNRNDGKKDMNPEWDIYLYNISTGAEKLISTAEGIHTNPNISDNKVVWEDGRNFHDKKEVRWGSNLPKNNTDVYMYEINTGKEFPIANGPLQECNPDVYQNYIIWEDRNNNSLKADIYLYDLDNGKKIRITKNRANQAYPRIYNDYIVWMDERKGISSNDVIINGKMPNSDIYLYNIKSKKEYLVTGKEPQIMPDITSNYIAYITSRQINPEIVVIHYQ